jgi:hypothetical protein
VSLFRRAKIGFHADVDLLIAALEPAAAASAKRGGLFDLRKAEQRAVELSSGKFRAFWSGQLDVVDARDHVVCLGPDGTPFE